MQVSRRQVQQPKALSSESKRIIFDVQNDSWGILLFSILIYGFVVLNIASGTVVMKQGSFANNVFKFIKVEQGGIPIKSNTAEFYRAFDGSVNKGVFPELCSTAGASSDADPITPVAGGAAVSVGTDGQYMNLKEHINIYFKNMYTPVESLQWKTALRTMERPKVQIIFEKEAFSNMLGTGNTSDITFGNLDDMYIDVYMEELVEQQAGEARLPANTPDKLIYEIQEDVTIRANTKGGQVSDSLLGGGKEVISYWMRMRNNFAGATNSNTGYAPSDSMIVDLKLRVDNVEDWVQQTTWKQNKRSMFHRFGYLPVVTNSKTEMDGFNAFIFVDKFGKGAKLSREKSNINLVYSTAADASTTFDSKTAKMQSVVHYYGDVILNRAA